jgi:large conductance mechanosensitive channel
MFKEFKEFAMRGNVIDMAVGIIVGGAFGKIVSSLVTDVVMPPIGLLTGKVDFSNLYVNLSSTTYDSLAAAQVAGVPTINYGLWLMTVVNFLIVAVVIFFVIRWMNKLQRQPEAATAEPTMKNCPFCLSTIPIKATRCAACTSELQGVRP